MSMDESQQDPFRRGTPFGEDNPFRDNPYASPELPSGQGPGGPIPPYAHPPSRSMVRHVPIVAILMIVQGFLEILMGLGYVGMGIMFPVMMRMEMEQQGGPPGGPPPEAMMWILLAIYGGMGLVAMVAAMLHIFAGVRNYRFRGRVLGLVALGGGMATVLTCYCAPTAVGLGVYGLITYLNPEVIQAFAMGESGKKREEILAALG